MSPLMAENSPLDPSLCCQLRGILKAEWAGKASSGIVGLVQGQHATILGLGADD